jgi:hypothetical protein
VSFWLRFECTTLEGFARVVVALLPLLEEDAESLDTPEASRIVAAVNPYQTLPKGVVLLHFVGSQDGAYAWTLSMRRKVVPFGGRLFAEVAASYP